MTAVLGDLGISFVRGSLPMWGTFLLALLALVLRFTPVWRRISLSEIGALKAEVATMKDQLLDISTRCNAYYLRMGQQEFALAMAIEEIESKLPQSRIPAQIRAYMSASLPNFLPSGTLQQDMDKLRAAWKRLGDADEEQK